MNNILRIEKLQDSFFDWCVDVSNGLLNENQIDKLIQLVENEIGTEYFTKRALINFQRIVESQFDKSLFLIELVSYPKRISVLLKISINSNFLTDFIVRNPSFIYQLFQTSFLEEKFNKATVQNLFVEQFNRLRTSEKKLQFARRFKNLYLLKIAVRDFLNLDLLIETTQNISDLANIISEVVFEYCLELVEEKYSIKINEKTFVLISLGKLGGSELNYSSDIDLIAMYEKNDSYGGITFHEIITQALTLFIQFMTTTTDQGFLYRVDFRLRPEGKYSPLAKKLSDYITYYESKGEDWEAQMLIKSNYVCGDFALFQKFQKQLDSFIYKSSFSKSYLENVRKMKKRIEAESKSDYDIKRFSGGIRDIEFSVQVLQTLNAKRLKNLKTGNTLQAIQNLFNENLIDENERELLSTNYIKYRKIEHFLQLENDFQTHSIPSNEEITERIAFYFFNNSKELFFEELNNSRKQVRQLFLKITSSQIKIDIENEHETNISNTTYSELTKLIKGESLNGSKSFDSKTLSHAKKIEDNLLEYLKQSRNQSKVILNFRKISELHPFPSIFFKEMEDERFLKITLQLCEYSEKFISNLVQNKTWLEDYLSRKVFTEDLFAPNSNIDLPKLLFYLNVQFLEKIINADEFSEILKGKLTEIIKKEFAEYFLENEFVLYGLGSFGSNELSFSSDIDLVIISKSKVNLEDEKKAQEFNQRINKLIFPFSADYRLRPEGQSSQLVWEIEELKKYLLTRASVWEFIAFTKINFIAGSKELYDEIVDAILISISKFSKNEIVEQSKNMYRTLIKQKRFGNKSSFNLKKNHGSLLTIDFILQTSLLLDKNFFTRLVGKANSKKIRKLLEEEILIIHNRMRTLQIYNQSHFDKQTTNIFFNEDFDFSPKLFDNMCKQKIEEQFMKDVEKAKNLYSNFTENII